MEVLRVVGEVLHLVVEVSQLVTSLVQRAQRLAYRRRRAVGLPLLWDAVARTASTTGPSGRRSPQQLTPRRAVRVDRRGRRGG